QPGTEGGLRGVELQRSARNPRPARHDGARHQRTHQRGALWVAEGLEAAAESIGQTVARRLNGAVAVDRVARGVVGHGHGQGYRVGRVRDLAQRVQHGKTPSVYVSAAGAAARLSQLRGAATSRTRAISDGTPKRLGGPQ